MAIPITYSLRSLSVRKGATAMAVAGIALVVIVFTVLLALAAGFERAVATSGCAQNLIVLRKGADAEMGSQVFRESGRIIAELPQVAADAQGPLFHFESVVLLQRSKRDGGESNVTLRGTAPEPARVHTDVALTEGRWFRPGTEEAVIGVSLARRIQGFEVGEAITAGRRSWKVVGLFEARGSALESEIWIDVGTLQSTFNRGNIYQSLLFTVHGDPDVACKALNQVIENDPRLRSVQALTERGYYRKQAELMTAVITVLGQILTGIMSIGAIVGAMNTMYAAVSHRRREIGCLLAIGFSPESIWFAFILESLALSAVGALLGCAVALLFNGLKTGTTNWATFSETAFEFAVTPQILLLSAGLAMGMGFAGGLLPAIQASRLKVVEALRRA